MKNKGGRLLEKITHCIKLFLRGIAFLVYFPFQLIYQIIKIILIPLERLWKHIILPILTYGIGYPVYYLIVVPLRWLSDNMVIPVVVFLWGNVIVPIVMFLWKHVFVWIYTIFYYVFIVPIVWLWEEIIVVVARWASQIIAWLACIIWWPIKWIIESIVIPIFRWWRDYIWRPTAKWFADIFR
jgi:hypothetical protein